LLARLRRASVGKPWPGKTRYARRSGTTLPCPRGLPGRGTPVRPAPHRPADRTAARWPTRAESEQAIRRGWDEPPRTRLRREVCTAAAGARTEQEFFTGLARAGVLVRRRYSAVNPSQVTGYAVGLPEHTGRDGHPIWYGGKLAADLTLPKLRTRWSGPQARETLAGAEQLSRAAVRAVLRAAVAEAAEHATDETQFFTRLRTSGVLVRERFSEVSPAEVTGYAQVAESAGLTRARHELSLTRRSSVSGLRC
jgi:hypothetical protein